MCAFVGACAIELDHEFDGDSGASGPGEEDSGSPAIAAGCALFQSVPGVTGIAGDTRSLPMEDGGALWVVDHATLADGAVSSPAVIDVGAGAGADCASWTATVEGSALAASPIEPQGLLGPLDLASGSDGPALYYQLFAFDPSAPLGLRSLGVGVAPQDPGSGAFVPTSELLWATGRPTYGGGALRVGDMVYVYGCASSGFLTDDCFVARADASALDSTAAYTYFTGATWSPSADDAAPIAQAGGAVSVRPDPGGKPRFIMTYVTPLGSTLVARSAPAPEGPWSAPVTLASCDLDGAGPGAFCAGGRQHPELVPGGALLALTYDAATFASDAGDTSAFWPRLVTLEIPSALP
jgi:hypothetical protein